MKAQERCCSGAWAVLVCLGAFAPPCSAQFDLHTCGPRAHDAPLPRAPAAARSPRTWCGRRPWTASSNTLSVRPGARDSRPPAPRPGRPGARAGTGRPAAPAPAPTRVMHSATQRRTHYVVRVALCCSVLSCSVLCCSMLCSAAFQALCCALCGAVLCYGLCCALCLEVSTNCKHVL